MCHLPESFLLASILPDQWVDHQEGSGMIGQRQGRNESHHQKPGTLSRAAEQSFLFLMLSAWAPLPNKVSALSAVRLLVQFISEC